MVQDPDCPLDVLETVATYDLDQPVLEAIYFLPNLSDKIKSSNWWTEIGDLVSSDNSKKKFILVKVEVVIE